MGPINPQEIRSREWYIIILIEYFTRWYEATLITYCIVKVVAWFMLENAVTRFGCLLLLLSDEGTQFMNKTTATLKEEFQIHHHKIKPDHPHANGAMEDFNKSLENSLTKIFNVGRDD